MRLLPFAATDRINSSMYLEDLLLDDIRSYRFLTNGPVPVAGVDDREMLRETTEAMTIMGMSADEQASVFRIVSAVLLMGNMQFKTERNTDQAVLPDNTGNNAINSYKPIKPYTHVSLLNMYHMYLKLVLGWS